MYICMKPKQNDRDVVTYDQIWTKYVKIQLQSLLSAASMFTANVRVPNPDFVHKRRNKTL